MIYLLISLPVGYPLTQYSIRPFQETDLTNDPEERALREEFNFKLSRLRVRIEHVFGRLKGRFPYLRYIYGFKTKHVYYIIEALLVVHNFLELRRDVAERIPHYNGREDDDVQEVLEDAFGRNRDRVQVSSSQLRRMGIARRKELLNRMRGGTGA
ncbi:hypothetical protein K466DRAFT_507143 [Polyporus arcularius HHB13444]|uniref:DDE Tnp4 domain-containing protein n=1 Tax=Polyporus arcularius HHB13444 TaxID=1314778 RepID=A0A5C3NMU6_9APHY|nr:hypothetical protein K466DRAFT_507143 [Polyporus arcularius HHB13444]